MADKYKETASNFVEVKYEKLKTKPSDAGAVIAIILHRDPQERVPEWEEVASVACAVENMWVALKQYDLGGYWSSPVLVDFLGEHVSLQSNEKCLGFFYLGYCKPSDRVVPKKPIEEKVEWIDQ